MIASVHFRLIAAIAICTAASGFQLHGHGIAAKNIIAMSSVIKPDSISLEAAGKFIRDVNNLKFSPTSGGVNNIVQYVESGDGTKYVLRIYNNGLNSARVNYEHKILSQLRPRKLSFKLPTTFPSLSNGKSHVILSNGAEASLFELIPGVLPKLTRVKEIGRASGELNTALADVKIIDQECPTPPYYELFKVHHAVTREKFFSEVEKPVFDSCRDATNRLVKYILDIEKKVANFDKLQLPKQIIHGDLHYDNVLCDGDYVSGLLDFEFCSYDWRAMELAVCLSKYAGEKEAMSYFEEFVTGFAEHGRLTDAEIKVIPDLINLRVLSNVVYFVGRALAKEDGIESLTTRANTYATRVEWINSKSDEIVELIMKKMSFVGAAARASN